MPEPVTSETGKSTSGIGTAARRAERAPFGWYVAWTWLGTVVLAAVFAPLLPLWDPAVPDYTNVFGGITPQHWLGGDTLGRDTFSRVIHGARASLLVGICAVGLGALVGGFLGMLAGYFGGRTERVLALVTDVVLAFPGLVFIIAVVAILGSSLTNLILGLAILSVPTFIRLARAATLVVAQREFVLAARAMGATSWRIIVRELVPNVLRPLLSYAFLIVAVLVVAEASLSFLGVGIQRPTPTWGNMIAAGEREFQDHPHMVFIPGTVMFLSVFSINRVGDRMRARWDSGSRSG